MALIPTPSQRINARRKAELILVDAIRSGATRTAGWVGSAEHTLRSALIEADYRDGFPDTYPAEEVAEARALIIAHGSAQ